MNPSKYASPFVTAGSEGVTCFERNRDVTTTPEMPGPRAVDQPPFDSCRDLRNSTALRESASGEGLAAACSLLSPVRGPWRPARAARPAIPLPVPGNHEPGTLGETTSWASQPFLSGPLA